MKTVSKKLFSLLLVAVLLVSVLPFQASASTLQFDFYTRNGSSYELLPQNSKTVVPSSAGAVAVNAAPTAPQLPGLKFVGWVRYTAGMTVDQVNAAEIVNLNSLFTSNTAFAPKYTVDQYSVSFSVGGKAGVTAPAAMTIVNNKEFGASGGMPVPSGTPNGYQFGGWKYGDVILDHSTWYSTKFTSGANITLEAVWVPNEVTVTFYRWSSANNAYEAIKAVTAKYGSTVNVNDIPTLEQVDTKPYYKSIGWQTTAGTDALAIDPANATLTGDTHFYARYLGDVVTITLDPKDSKLDATTKDVRIGEKLGNYGGKLPTPALTGYTFIGWYTPDGTKVDDETIFWNSYSKLEAHWAVQAQVRLLVYKDGNTTTPIVSRLIPGGVVNGSLDVDTIAISSYLPSGATYKLTGYFDKDGWSDYVMNGIVRTVDNVKCGSTGVTEVYAMVQTVSTNTNTNTGSGSGNTGSGTNTGTTTKPADPTNPATGDDSMIVASVTVMTLSAAALVVFMQLRKRKMF